MMAFWLPLLSRAPTMAGAAVLTRPAAPAAVDCLRKSRRLMGDTPVGGVSGTARNLRHTGVFCKGWRQCAQTRRRALLEERVKLTAEISSEGRTRPAISLSVIGLPPDYLS